MQKISNNQHTQALLKHLNQLVMKLVTTSLNQD